MPVDPYTKCRTCLGDLNAYHKLFDYVEENYKIVEMLDGVVPQIDIKTTQFSTLICQSCVDKLLISYKFQRLCIETNDQLHDMLGIPLFETVPEQDVSILASGANIAVKQEIEAYDTPDEKDLETRSDNSEDGSLTGKSEVNRFKQLASCYGKKREISRANSTSEEAELSKVLKVDNSEDEYACKELVLHRTFKTDMHVNVGINSTDKLQEKIAEAADEHVSKIIVKEEFEYTSQIFQEFTDNLEDNEDMINNGYESSDDILKNTLHSNLEVKYTKSTDLVDNGISEVENRKNRRNIQYHCEVCGKTFPHPFYLKRHSTVVHSLKRPYECKICKYRFFSASLLNSHLTKHKSEMEINIKCSERPNCLQFPCMVCQRSFRSIRSLTRHTTKKHPEVKKHKCDQCDKTFLLHTHLLEHLNRHRENENLLCLICKKEFRYEFMLREHMNLHTGEIPYMCNMCGRIFRHTGSLNRHMRVHDESRYQCTQCGRKLSNSTNLRHHEERHAVMEKYWCSECPSHFCIRSDLIRHEIIYHSKFENLENPQNK